MELIIKNGMAYWSPTSLNEAFRIFSDVYTRAFPDRAAELIQYNHVIHSISLSYTWENVYSYDKEFRMHLSKHPE